MNGLALAWVDEALALEEENRLLRAVCTTLVIELARHVELCAFASAAIDERFVEREAA